MVSGAFLQRFERFSFKDYIETFNIKIDEHTFW